MKQKEDEIKIASLQDSIIKGNIDLQKEKQLSAQLSIDLENVKNPRVLSPASTEKLVDNLSKLPKEQIEVISLAGCDECYQFAFQIHDIIRRAGWPISEDIKDIKLGNRGVMVTANGEKYNKIVTDIVAVFKLAGLDMPYGTWYQPPPNYPAISIYVGTKNYRGAFR